MLKSIQILVFIVVQLKWFVPVDAAQCYSCSSNEDRKCVHTKNSDEKLITCNASCVNAILPDSSLFRGCLSDLPKNVLKQESCHSDYCNANIFPTDRLACYQCDGSECANVSPPLHNDTYLCQNYADSDTCFVVAGSPSNVSRGCSSDNDHLPSQFEKKCKTHLCNKQAAHKKLTCWECDSAIADELACKQGKTDDGEIGKCEMDVLYGHFGSCYVLHEAEYVRRGCSNDEVYAATNRQITTCETSLCNSMEISIAECYECDSNSDENCLLLNSKRNATSSCPAGISSCYSCRDFGNVVQRGCGQPEQCIGSCFPCWNGSLCNSNMMYECYSCSAEDNIDCELFTHPDRVDQEICSRGCQVFLLNNILHRSCLNETVECTDSNSCSPCFSDNCNDYFINTECDVVKFDNTKENSMEQDNQLI